MTGNWLDQPCPPSIPAGDFSAVTRVEVIEAGGRVAVRYGVSVEVHVQDEGRTLKVFLTERDSEGEQANEAPM